MVLIIDTETSGLEGYPRDRVLEIGIAELKDDTVSQVYSEVIRYPESLISKGPMAEGFGSTGTPT